MCNKNTFLNFYYSTRKIASLMVRTGRGYQACSPSVASVKDDRESIQGASGAIS